MKEKRILVGHFSYSVEEGNLIASVADDWRTELLPVEEVGEFLGTRGTNKSGPDAFSVHVAQTISAFGVARFHALTSDSRRLQVTECPPPCEAWPKLRLTRLPRSFLLLSRMTAVDARGAL